MTSENRNTHASGDGTAHGGPVYYECSACGFLSHDAAFRDADVKCPACGSNTGVRRLFPPDRLRRVDTRIRGYMAEGETEVVVILAATFLESLLEDMLARIMATEGASVKLRAAVLDTMRSVGQRIGKLFPTLTGVQFEDAATEAGFERFPRRWRSLRAERNAFIHDATFEGAREELGEASAREAIELLDQAYKLFVRINNRFVAGQRHRRSDDAAR
jgi:DNA-directed RNA polymerase subunit RPC12/RpoP